MQISSRLANLITSLQQKRLSTYANAIKQLQEELDLPNEETNPLLDSSPTEMPGTWSEPDGSLVKTSKE